MSPDHPEPAPPLEPEDLALESTLTRLRPRGATPDFLDRLLYHLELTVSDDTAASSPDSPPMPLDASLLAFEHELRALRPLDMDFPTGQRVLQALAREMTPAAPPAFSVLTGADRSAPPRRQWAAALPWAAAAALVAVSWVALPYLRTSGHIASATDTGLIPFAPHTGEKGSVALVFPTPGRPDPFRMPFGDKLDAGTLKSGNDAWSPRAPTIPEATSPYGHLDVTTFDLPDEYCAKLGIKNGIGILSMGAGGPASTQGLEVGDIILRINGAPVSTADEFSVMIKNSAPGSTITLKVLRGRLIGEIPVRLASAPSA